MNIMLIFNNIMEKKLIKLNNYKKSLSDNYLNKVNKFLNIKIEEWDGCILIDFKDNLKKLPSKFEPNDYIIDRTQLEAEKNHIYIDEVIENINNDEIESLKLAKIMAEILEKRLKKQFPKYKFYIIISQDEYSTSIRFYKIRENEIIWFDEKKINNYNQEALLVFKF